MCVSWCGTAVERHFLNAGPLAIIAPWLDAMGIETILDRHLPQGPQQEFPDSQVLLTLLAARLCRPNLSTPLVDVAEWASESGAEVVFGVPADKLNDDRLGRALDHFFEHRFSILASVADKAIRDFEISRDFVHFDPTHITFAGAYDTSVSRPKGKLLPPTTAQADFPPAHITYGYVSTNIRIVHLAVTSAIDRFGSVPLFAHAVPGNQNGHTAIAETLHLLQNYLPLPKSSMMIADRGTFSLAHLSRMHDADHHVLSSASWSDYQSLYDLHRDKLQWRQASYLSIEQRRRRDTPSSLSKEHYEIAELKHPLQHARTGLPIDARFLFVRSSAAQKVEEATRLRQIEKIRKGLDSLQKTLARNHKATKLDSIPKRVAAILGKKSAARFVRWSLDPLTEAERAALPPPAKDCTRPTHRLMYVFDQQALDEAAQYDGLSVLVTTAHDSFDGDQLFSQFKKQTYLEQCHHQFKGPLAVSPLFLKNPQRVEALALLLHLASTAYHLLQREYRRRLPADAPIAEQRKTTETILKEFRHYPLLVEKVPGGQIIRPTHASQTQRRTMHRLPIETFEQLLHRRLPRHANEPPPQPA